MDPLTHGMIGLALSTFSGQSVSISNPIALGCAIGAMIPDIDSVIRLYANDATYLKQHRGFSHSLPMLFVFSAVVATAVAFFAKVPITQIFETIQFADLFRPDHFAAIWLWSFLGALSHTVFDMLNSYGAMLLRKKRKLNLLTLYDPVIAILGIGLIFQRQINWEWNLVAVLLFSLYMLFRHRFRKHAAVDLSTHSDFVGEIQHIAVLPALTAFYRWDFIVTTDAYTYVGKYNQWSKGVRVIERFDAQCPQHRETFDQTALGEYFNDFSPYLHVVHAQEGNAVTMRVIDLRYYVRNRFLHQATLVVDKRSGKIHQSVLHPYGHHRSVAFDESKTQAMAS